MIEKPRKKIARALWDFASWLYPSDKTDPPQEQQGWEVSFYFQATGAEADAVFDRLSDAICGADHHALERCPGPMHIGGMHPEGRSLDHLDADGLAMEMRAALGAVAEAVSSANPPVSERTRMACAVARDKIAAYDRAVLSNGEAA